MQNNFSASLPRTKMAIIKSLKIIKTYNMNMLFAVLFDIFIVLQTMKIK